jgi:hypothetical protein
LGYLNETAPVAMPFNGNAFANIFITIMNIYINNASEKENKTISSYLSIHYYIMNDLKYNKFYTDLK